jgi:hypothetical protein
MTVAPSGPALRSHVHDARSANLRIAVGYQLLASGRGLPAIVIEDPQAPNGIRVIYTRKQPSSDPINIVNHHAKQLAIDILPQDAYFRDRAEALAKLRGLPQS